MIDPGREKSVALAIMLAIVAGAIGCGAGHFYLKQGGEGLAYTVAFWLIIGIALWLLTNPINQRYSTAADVNMTFAVLLSLIIVGLWTAQIYHVAGLARKWNLWVRETGQKLW